MTSSDKQPGPIPATQDDVPGQPRSVGSILVDKTAQVVQSFTPIKQFQQHGCSWAKFGHDMGRQIETHHYVSRLNEDFLQCAVYDSDGSGARLIGVEYVISDRLFEALTLEEQKLWHSHYYNVTSGLWLNPGVPESIQKSELRKFARSYGKFWCTWQFDRGDRLPLGAPAVMMSPQVEESGKIKEELIKKRDDKYGIDSKERGEGRRDVEGPASLTGMADYWKSSGTGLAVEFKETDMILKAGAPLSTLILSQPQQKSE